MIKQAKEESESKGRHFNRLETRETRIGARIASPAIENTPKPEPHSIHPSFPSRNGPDRTLFKWLVQRTGKTRKEKVDCASERLLIVIRPRGVATTEIGLGQVLLPARTHGPSTCSLLYFMFPFNKDCSKDVSKRRKKTIP